MSQQGQSISPALWLELEQQILGPPGQRLEFCPGQRETKTALQSWPQAFRTINLNLPDRFPGESPAKMSHQYFNFRQFRHKSRKVFDGTT
jgi:hypothetical protein